MHVPRPDSYPIYPPETSDRVNRADFSSLAGRLTAGTPSNISIAPVGTHGGRVLAALSDPYRDPIRSPRAPRAPRRRGRYGENQVPSPAGPRGRPPDQRRQTDGPR